MVVCIRYSWEPLEAAHLFILTILAGLSPSGGAGYIIIILPKSNLPTRITTDQHYLHNCHLYRQSDHGFNTQCPVECQRRCWREYSRVITEGVFWIVKLWRPRHFIRLCTWQGGELIPCVYTLFHLEIDRDVSSWYRIIMGATSVFSHVFKKESLDWRTNDVFCSVYASMRWVTSQSFLRWDKV